MKNLNSKVPKLPFSQANRNHNHDKDIQVGIFPKQILIEWFQQFSRTWHGHSEWFVLKVWTQTASQFVSSLQSKMHWPRVLLFFDRQASMLSSSVASFNKNIFEHLSSINKLTLQKHIGFWQLLQPSRQSLWHGQAELKYQSLMNKTICWIWNYMLILYVEIYLVHNISKQFTIATDKRLSLAFQHAIAIATSTNTL